MITDFIADDLAPSRRILGDIATLTALDAATEDQLVGRIEEADAIMMYHTLPITRRTIFHRASLKHCKLIVRCGVGFDNVDHAFGRHQKRIPVANVPDYGTEDVADTAIGMMLALARGIHPFNSGSRAGLGPWSYTQFSPLRRLRGQKHSVSSASAASASRRYLRQGSSEWTSFSTTPSNPMATTNPSAFAVPNRSKTCSSNLYAPHPPLPPHRSNPSPHQRAHARPDAKVDLS